MMVSEAMTSRTLAWLGMDKRSARPASARPRSDFETSWAQWKAQNPRLRKKDALSELVRGHKVPPQHRAELWATALGSDDPRQREMPYASYVAQEESVPEILVQQIDHDVPRTFPNVPEFQLSDGPARLRRVLIAFAARDTQVGYCQSLNFIAGVFLTVLQDEELSFWSLVAFIQRLGTRSYYFDGMSLLRADIQVVQWMLSVASPQLAKHLSALNYDLNMVVGKWLLAAFSASDSFVEVIALWDQLLVDGIQVLFRVVVARLRRHERELHAARSFDELVECTQMLARPSAEGLSSGMLEDLTAAECMVERFPKQLLLQKRAELHGQVCEADRKRDLVVSSVTRGGRVNVNIEKFFAQ
jgi:hypothetical protein